MARSGQEMSGDLRWCQWGSGGVRGGQGGHLTEMRIWEEQFGGDSCQDTLTLGKVQLLIFLSFFLLFNLCVL